MCFPVCNVEKRSTALFRHRAGRNTLRFLRYGGKAKVPGAMCSFWMSPRSIRCSISLLRCIEKLYTFTVSDAVLKQLQMVLKSYRKRYLEHSFLLP